MSILEKLSGVLKEAGENKFGMEKALLTVMAEWKDFEKHLGLTQMCFREALMELESREEKLNTVQKSLDSSSRELDSVRQSLANREEELRVLREVVFGELEVKKEELEFMMKDALVREEKLSERDKVMYGILQRIEVEHGEIKEIRKIVDEKIRKIGLEEELIEERSSYVRSIENVIERKAKEIEAKEDNLEECLKGLDFLKQELVAKEKELERKAKEIEAKEDNLECLKDLDLLKVELGEKERELESMRVANEKLSRELECREDNLYSRSEELDCKERSIKKLTRDYYKGFHSKINEFQLEKNLFEQRSKELEVKEREIVDRYNELKLEEELIKDLGLKGRVKDRELADRFNELQCREQYIADKFDDLAVRTTEIEQWLEHKSRELASKEKQIADRLIDVFFRERDKEKQLENRLRELELKEKQIDEQYKELELKGKRFQAVFNANDAITHDSADIRMFVRMDGKSLQTFLNDCEMNHELMAEEVFRALHLSEDPSKLVLDAMEGFFPPHLKKRGDEEFDSGVVRRTCITLLKQLIRICPEIRPCIQEEALKLASDWKVKMRAMAKDPMELFGFLYLLVAYGVASAFDADELFGFLEIVVQHKESPELCRLLGLTDKIPGFIEILVKKEQFLEAARYILAFQLVDRFPLVLILTGYLTNVEKTANSICKGTGYSSRTKEDEAVNQKIAAARDLIVFIAEHKLESQFSPQTLQEYIERLMMQKEDEYSKELMRHKEDNHISTSTAIRAQDQRVVETSASSKACAPNPSCTNAMAIILSKMDGKNLGVFLNQHLEEHDLIGDDVFAALEMSEEPGKLVLDAIRDPSHSKEGETEYDISIIRKSCILLLDRLLRLAPQIKPEIREDACKLALDWRTKIQLEKENPLEILGFLLLIGSYRLTSVFELDDLLYFYRIVAPHGHSPDLPQALGISEELLDFQLTQAERSNLSVIPRHGLRFSGKVNMEKKEPDSICSDVPISIRDASDPAKLILDALRSCYFSYLDKRRNKCLQVMKSYFHVLEQLMKLSTDIELSVRDEAHMFARQWMRNLKKASWESSAFLQLLAAYGISSYFDADKLIGILAFVHKPKIAFELLRMLGLIEKLPKLILKRRSHASSSTLSPVALLKDFISYTRKSAMNLRKMRTLEARERAVMSELSASEIVVKVILEHDLASEYSPNKLKARISELQRERANILKGLGKFVRKGAPQAPKKQSQIQEATKRPGEDDAICEDARPREQREKKRRRLPRSSKAAPDRHGNAPKRHRVLAPPAEQTLADPVNTQPQQQDDHNHHQIAKPAEIARYHVDENDCCQMAQLAETSQPIPSSCPSVQHPDYWCNAESYLSRSPRDHSLATPPPVLPDHVPCRYKVPPPPLPGPLQHFTYPCDSYGHDNFVPMHQQHSYF